MLINDGIFYSHYTFRKIGNYFYIVDEYRNKKNPRQKFLTADDLYYWATLWLMKYKPDYKSKRYITFKKVIS